MPELTLPIIARVSPKPDGEFTPIYHTFTEKDADLVFNFFRNAYLADIKSNPERVKIDTSLR